MARAILPLVLMLTGCHGIFTSRSIDRAPPLFWNVEVGVENVGELIDQERPGWAALSSLLLPFDVVVVPKKAIAKFKDFLDQYLYDLIPPLKNSSFFMVYDLNQPDFKVEGTLPP